MFSFLSIFRNTLALCGTRRLMTRSQGGRSWGVRSPVLLTMQESPLQACVYVSLRVFPPTALHPILLNKGAWGSGIKWEAAHEWKGTNWHVAFCEVSAQPLDRWLPFANEHPGLCVCVCVSPCFICPCFSAERSFSSLQLCAAQSGQWTIGVPLIGRRTHQ